jgi:single-stranded-DNA-specific exonuclease
MSYPLLDFESILSRLEARFSQSFLTLADLPSPYEFKDMQRSLERIIQAINDNEKIVLVGDYDVDGVMATSIMARFFQEMDVPLETVIPNRFADGYGLSASVLERIDEANLIVTVDNGIAAVEAANICQQREIDLIITDHHIVPDILPVAYAIVDQKQPECTFPYEEVCGAQIAWYLCAALNRELDTKIDMKKYLDMTAIAIVADMMPLTHINRTMVQAGLQQFARSEWPFVQAYREARPKRSYMAEDLGFTLAPMINSAGRLEDASVALDYVTAPNIYEARGGYEKLNELNNRRKQLEQEVTDSAAEQVDPEAKIIVVSGEGWHEGVVGIAAARLARRFERPAIVLSQNGNICKGSGRSWRECHLYNLLALQRDMMLRFGGHKGAIGMGIESDRLDGFSAMLQNDAAKHCADGDVSDPDIIGELPFGLIDSVLLRLFERFEPFGQGNPKPKFITRGVTIASAKTMGKENNHLRFSFQSDKLYVQGVQFRTTQQHTIGSRADIIYTLNENHFRGETTIQLMVEKIDVHNKKLDLGR